MTTDQDTIDALCAMLGDLAARITVAIVRAYGDHPDFNSSGLIGAASASIVGSVLALRRIDPDLYDWLERVTLEEVDEPGGEMPGLYDDFAAAVAVVRNGGTH